MSFCVYILASDRNGTTYIGITNDVVRRVWEHKEKINKKSFSSKYSAVKLVYYEFYDNPSLAIAREKRLKRYKRIWKLELIEKLNPQWKDLYDEVNH